MWRQVGGWWDGAPSRSKPARDAEVAAVIAELAAADAGDFRLAGHRADHAGWPPDDPAIHRDRGAVYRARRAAEPSLTSKGIFAAAARASEAITAEGTVTPG